MTPGRTGQQRMARRWRRREVLQLGAGLAGAALAATGCSQREAAETGGETPRVFAPYVARDGGTTPGPSLEERIGQMVLAGFRGLRVSEGDPIAANLADDHLGAVILFDYDVAGDSATRNVESPEQVAALVRDVKGFAPMPLIVAVDQEGGAVARLDEDHGFPATVSAEYLGSVNNRDVTYEHARAMAQTLANVGINVNLAPVVDLNVNPDNPIIGALGRSFSADPDIVVDQATAFIKAHHDNGVLTTLKHFPGHGSSRQDSHLGFVDVTQTWSPVELEPYERLVAAGMADAVMTAHVFNANLDQQFPATLSKATITGILREQIGFEGVVFSDDMQMRAISEHYGLEEAVRLAVEAGVDVLTFGNNLVHDDDIVGRTVGIIRRMVEDGSIAESRIDASWERIQAYKAQLSA